MPTATITVNNICINVQHTCEEYFATDTFPYAKLFCKFIVHRSLRSHDLYLVVRQKTKQTPLLKHRKRGVYNRRFDIFFGRVFWDMNELLNGIDYGELEYSLQLKSIRTIGQLC